MRDPRRDLRKPAAGAAGRTLWSRIGRVLLTLLLTVLLLPIPFVAAYRFLPPPITPLMLIRSAEGEKIQQKWAPLARISPWLPRAVIASEDARFCLHHGFDFQEMGAALERYRAGGRLRGASTLSQQTAKNLLLWPGRNLVRKALEAYITVLLELGWPKSRILEIYLNIVEWGPGVYGAEAAAAAHFHKPAAALSRREAALLAAVLPNPRILSADRPSPYVEERAATIEARMLQVDVPGTRACR